MALQGTLETFALPDVLRLLASTKKTGVLRVDTDRGHGEIHVVDGALGGGTAERAPRAEAPSDLLFEMLRSGMGSFVFDTDAPVDAGAEVQDVETALTAAESLLSEWSEISAVVPSPHREVTLAPDHDGDITLSSEQWRVVATIGGGCTVDQLGERLEQTELVATRAVRDLVEVGAVSLSDTDVAGASAAVAPAPTETDAPVAPVADVAPESEPPTLTADPDSFIAAEPNPLPPLPMRQANGHAPEPAAPAEPVTPVAPVAPLFGDAPAEAVAEAPAPEAPAAAAATWEPDAFGDDSSSFFDDDDEDPLADDPFGPDPFRIPRLPTAEEAETDSEAAEMARQLSNLSPRAAQAVAAAAAATTDEEREQALAQATEDTEDPVNRGLLLKFLSSVDD